ncbi:polycystin-1-like protein 2 [Babylonia areolata]|uniref:polycystin-1-like protein 2 n=1 Tax=Babylonia areolata TaxID=304850 RepID=UPI003FD3ABF7
MTAVPEDPCLFDPCPSHSTCRSDHSGYFNCTCHVGYTSQDQRCLDVDECLSDPCPANAQCTNTAGGYFCSCLPGFWDVGDLCEGFQYSQGLCQRSYTCICEQGFILSNSLCEDIDECADAEACPSNAVCHNSDGSFTCTCHSGYQDSNGLCFDVDECSGAGNGPCTEHADCINTEGSYQCVCQQGFQQQGSLCEDIDECLSSPCSEFSTCSNTAGNYSCVCQNDFYQSDAYTCLILNPTPERLFVRLAPGSTAGASSLQPLLAALSYDVQDVDECTEDGWSDCSEPGSVCTNTEGRYTCECDPAFVDYSPVTGRPGRQCYAIDDAHKQPITNLTITTTSEVYEVGSDVTINIAVMEGSHVAYSIEFVTTSSGSNLAVTLDKGNMQSETREIGNNRRGDSVILFPVKYSDVGLYRISVYAENTLSNATAELSHDIHVVNLVRDLTLTAPAIISFPPGEADVVIEYKQPSLPPTSVSCEVFSPNLQEHTFFSNEISSVSSLDFSLNFDDISAVGINDVVINCSNVLSYQILETSILMEAMIEKVEVSVSNTYIMVKGAVDINVTIEVGSHAIYELDFGDGEVNPGVFTDTLLQDERLTVRHAYVEAGLYNVTFLVSNRVSYSVAVKMVGVLEEVTDVEATAWYQPVDHNDTLQGGHGTLGSTFPLERDVIFHTTVASGNDITYTWEFNDGSPLISSRDSEMRHRFSQAGTFRVKVNASNALFSDVHYLTVFLHQTVLMHTLTNDGPTDAYRTVNFTLQLARPGTDTCFIWNMGDGSEDYVYGASHCSLYTSTSVSEFRSLEASLTSSLQLQQAHMYQSNHTFNIRVRAYNLVSQGEISDVAIMSGISCHYPEVRLEGGGQMIDQPDVYLKSQKISFTSVVDVNCQVTQEADVSWKIDQILTDEHFLDFYFTPITVNYTSAGPFKVSFKPSVFETGTYRVSLNVSMKGIPGLFHTDFAYFRIDPTPLVAHITGGNARSVGYDTAFVLDALADSYDPDLDPDDKTGLYFRWFCRRQDEVLPEEEAPDLVPIPTNISETDFNVTKGCFGTGPGRLQVGGNLTAVLELDSYLMEFGSTNVFSVEVAKSDGTGRTAVYEQAVTIVPGDPPDLTITCVTNCKSKVNPSGEFTLYGKCPECRPSDTVFYQWSLSEELEEGTLLSVPIPDNATTTGKTYRLRVYGTLAGYAPGFTEYRFVSNLPPYGGNCSINPEQGYALDTLFVINCHGWLNPGEEEAQGRGILYRFWIHRQGQQGDQLLYYGTDPYTPDSQLPLGLESDGYRYDVKVRISNPIGEYVEQPLVVKVTRPPAKLDMSAIEDMAIGESSVLSELFTTGREQEAKQLIVALASLLNTALRTEVVKALSRTTALSLDSLQQTVRAVKDITDETDEISEECQHVAVVAVQDMTSVLKDMVEGETLQSVEQELTIAKDIVASLGNILSAATEGVGLTDIFLDEGDSSSSSSSFTTLSPSTAAKTSATQPSSSGGTTGSPGPDLGSKRDQVRQITKKTMELTNTIVKTVLKRRVPGEPPVVLANRLFTVQAARNDLAGFNNSVYMAFEGAFALPAADNFEVSNETSFVDTQFVTNSNNLYSWDVSASYLTSPVVSLNLYDNAGQEIVAKDLREPIQIDISTGAVEEPLSLVTPFLVEDAELYYHAFETTWNSSQALSIVIKPNSTNETLEVFLKHGSLPTPSDYDWVYMFPEDNDDGGGEDGDGEEDGEYRIFIRNDTFVANETGVLYLGLRLYVNESSLEPDYSDYYTDPDDGAVRNESLPAYTITAFGSSCRFWDELSETWSTDGYQAQHVEEEDEAQGDQDGVVGSQLAAQVVEHRVEVDLVSVESTAALTRCLCSHLTSFGTGVFVAPNQIHFDTVFDDLGSKLADNYAVLVTLCLIFFLYVLGLVWARRMDRRDVEKWGATPLADNVLSDRYFYRMTIFTGARYGAGTRSQVSFVLSGDTGDTGVRQLADEKGKKTLSRGTITQYVLGVQEGLGPLSYLRVWHDNSGKGLHQGWYLGKVIVTDLQTGESYIFLCNRWLAVEEDDGHVDRILPVAGRQDLVDFQHLFFSETQRSLSDSHLWVSVFSRPRRSSFSRVQRLSCIVCLLLATMMADAMFYQTGGGADSESGAIEVGPVKVTIQELYVSFISSLLILPLNVLVDQIFRRTRPKAHRTDLAFMDQSAVMECPDVSRNFGDEDLSKAKSSAEVLGLGDDPPSDGSDKEAKSNTITAPPSQDKKTPPDSDGKTDDNDDDAEEDKQKQKKKQKKTKKKGGGRVMLPHWCVYVGWLLLVAMSGVSAFITFSYSMEWGREKSLAWLAALFLSVGQSVMVVQPIKIIVLAMVMAWACKKPKEEEEEEEEEAGSGVVDASQVQLKPDEEPTSCAPKMVFRPHLAAPPPNSTVLADSRERRQKEVATSRVVREIVAYLLYLLLLILVAAHNRDSRSFLWTSSIRGVLNSGPAVEEVGDSKQFWNWTRRVLVPNLYTETDYRGQLLPDAGSRVISTMAAYRVGPVRLRQHRVSDKPCKPVNPFSRHNIFCTQAWSWDAQETGTFLEGWTVAPESFVPGVNFAWTYLDWTQTDGIPYVGAISVYPAGGYVKDLIGSRERVEQFLSELEDLQWVDRYTRAIFVEMVLYNPNINLFAMVTVVFETPLTGKLQGDTLVHSFRLFSYLGGYGVLVAFCEAMIILCTIYFLYREAKKLWTQRLQYFRQFWNWMELGTVLGSVTAIVMYVGRHVLTSLAMKNVKDLRGKYYNFQRLSQWDELFSYLLAFVSFLAILKTVHLLRFNRKVSMLGSTLLRSAKDLSSFVIVFFFFFLAFFSSGFVLFGSQLAQYSSAVTTVETLMAVCLGEAQFQVLDEANRVLGPLYFFLYMMFVVFVLLNMFLTILNETFSAVRHDLSLQSNEYEVVDFMLHNLKNWLGSLPWKALFAGGQKGKYSDG